MLSLCLHCIPLELALHVRLFYPDSGRLQIFGDCSMRVVSKVFSHSFVLLAKFSEWSDWCKTELWLFKSTLDFVLWLLSALIFDCRHFKVWSELQEMTAQQSNLNREAFSQCYIQARFLFGYWNLWIFFSTTDLVCAATVQPTGGIRLPSVVNRWCLPILCYIRNPNSCVSYLCVSV